MDGKMAARVSRPGGHFWAISDLSGDEFSGDEMEEDTDRDAAPLPTIGDALFRARDLRGSRRKDKQERYVRLEERLRRCRELVQPIPPPPPLNLTPAPSVEPSFRYVQTPCSRRVISPPRSDCSGSGSEDWFQIRGDKAVRVGLDPLPLPRMRKTIVDAVSRSYKGAWSSVYV
jgi:hypothetical protein